MGNGYSSKISRRGIAGKLFLPALVLSVTMAAVALVASLTCFIHHKHKFKSQSSEFSFDKDMTSNSFTNLISQASSLTEEFQVYDNSCFSSGTGCMGRASFKFSGKSEAVPGTIVRRFSYSELNEATERFSKRNVIGLGGSSSVYRGLLKDGRAVAVKKLETRNGSDAESEFLIEVADFGMAKPITNNDVNGRPNSPAKMLSTFGYFAPEYAMMGRASLKSDVFSFGVVLLELISGRRPVNMSLPKGQQSLVIWIPFSLPWNPDCSDYNFSREDLDLDNSPMVAKQLNAQKTMASSIFEPEINKVCSPRWTKNHTVLLGIEEVLVPKENQNWLL